MLTRWSVVALASLMLVTLAAGAWAAPEAVSLELKGSPGESHTYRSTLDFSVDVEVKQPETGQTVFSLSPRASGWLVAREEVLQVADNGDLTFAHQLESFDFTLDVADLHARLAIAGPDGGPPQLIKLPRLPLEAVVSNRGKLVAIKGLEKLPIPPLPGPGGKPINLAEMVNGLLTGFSQPLYPDKPVAVGESWSWEMVVDPMAMMKQMGMPMPPEAQQQMPDFKIPIKSTSTLVGFETVNGVECARIEETAPWSLRVPTAGPDAPPLIESGSVKVVTWLDHAAGRPVRETTEFGVDISVGEGEAALMKMTMRGVGDTNLVP